MNNSKVIVTETENTKSKLIVAMKGWDESLKDFSEAPSGVFGSIAIIKCGDVTIRSDQLDLEFTVPFDDDMEANEAEIIIYNLSKTTISKLKRNATISITAGYKNDTGVIFKGYIDKKKTVFDGVDKITTLKCMDRVKTKNLKDVTFKAGTKASTILKELINKTGTPVAVFKVRRDHTYKDEVKVDGDLLENIKNYADVCGISVYINKGKIYARYIKIGDNINFTVKSDTGLIGSPSEFEEEQTAEKYNDVIKGYECEMLLQHRMTTAAIVTLKSRNVNGKYRVRSGTHTFNESEAITTIKLLDTISTTISKETTSSSGSDSSSSSSSSSSGNISGSENLSSDLNSSSETRTVEFIGRSQGGPIMHKDRLREYTKTINGKEYFCEPGEGENKCYLVSHARPLVIDGRTTDSIEFIKGTPIFAIH